MLSLAIIEPHATTFQRSERNILETKSKKHKYLKKTL